MYKSLKQEKGFLLLSTLVVIIFLTILSAAIFSQSVSENTFAKKSVAKLKAVYNAEFGLTCVANEVISASSWVTHTARKVGNDYVLDVSATAPIPSVPNTSIVGGNYSMPGIFEAKVYSDPIPDQDGQFIILSRGISGNDTYLLASKVSAESLYQYFYFSPGAKSLGWSSWDALGGKIHANGNISFGEWGSIINVSELSTGNYFNAGTIWEVPDENNCIRDDGGTGNCGWRDYFYSYKKPYSYPNPYISPDNYYNSPDGYVAGGVAQLYMVNPAYDPATFISNNPDTWRYKPCNNSADCILPSRDEGYADEWGGYDRSTTNNVGYEIYQIDGFVKDGVGTGNLTNNRVYINACTSPPCNNPSPPTIPIPSRFSNSYYETPRNGTPPPLTSGYQKDWDGDGDIERQTWVTEYREQNALNSGAQGQTWANWINSNPSLQGVVKDANSGGRQIAAIKINSQTYFDKAKEDGIYIFVDTADNKLKMEINGSIFEPVEEGGKQVFKAADGTIVAEQDSFVNSVSTNRKDMIRLKVDQLKAKGLGPSNGIIYADYDVMLENAQTLFEANAATGYNGGLTTVGSQNVYLKGDYNITNWKPSAVITAKYVYTLSDHFNFPKTLLATVKNINAPYHQGAGGLPPGGFMNPWAISNSDDQAPWIAAHGNSMPNLVDKDYQYNVSLVGSYIDSTSVLERWEGKKKTITGAQVVLPAGNFQWSGYPAKPSAEWDWSQNRSCANSKFKADWPAELCRNQSEFPGWGGAIPNTAIKAFNFETRYDITDSSTLPPGGLPGYANSVTLILSDTEYNFTHHPSQLN